MPSRQCPLAAAVPKCSHSRRSVIWRVLSNYPAPHLQVYYDRGVLPYSDLANATNFTTSQTNGEPGLRAEYFDNLDLKGTPVIARTEQHVDFGTAARLLFPEQTLSSRWTGYYTPPESGSYDIFVQTTRERGGSYRLYVDDKLVLDNWTTLTALVDYRTLRLDPRPHKIVLEQTDGRLDGLCASGWELFALDNSLATTPKSLLPALTWWW